MALVVDMEAVVDRLALEVGDEAGDVNDRHRHPLRAGRSRWPRLDTTVRFRGSNCGGLAFDVGETLIDESRIWTRWADRLGVTPLTMLGVLGAMAAVDRPHMDAFHVLRPGIDVDVELSRWRADDPDGLRENFDAEDLYGDVRTCFAALRGWRGAR